MTTSRPDDFDVTARIPAENPPGASSADSASASVGADAALAEGSPQRVGGQSIPLADDPDPQAATPVGASPVSTPGAGVRAEGGRSWYRRRWVAVLAVIALMGASFGAGWGTNELLSSDDAPAGVERDDFDPRQGGPGGQMPGGDGQMPGGGRMRDGDFGQMDGGFGSGRTTPNEDAPGGLGGGLEGDSGSEDGGSTGVLQESTSA
ncbi:hypothetical protein [Actinomyces qiguomingii]|uniref:hypothetical protein n=1 Tax=Actinomyces qiguomingii TaxID=2057800 RepID=UPI000CA08976|nr:hypothetical protein [Actinomyces qiguomingii]